MHLRCISRAAALVVALGGCHEHVTPPPGSPCSDREQVSLPTCESGADRFSDEACIALDDTIRRGATTNDARAGTITAPTEAQAIPTATPFTFTWTAPTARRAPRVPTWRDELLRLVTPLPEAHAHCDPFTGRAYELRIAVGATVILRRQQSATSWTPTAAEWAYLTRTIGTQTAQLTLYTASMVNNQITAGNGPFVPAMTRRFTLAR